MWISTLNIFVWILTTSLCGKNYFSPSKTKWKAGSFLISKLLWSRPQLLCITCEFKKTEFLSWNLNPKFTVYRCIDLPLSLLCLRGSLAMFYTNNLVWGSPWSDNLSNEFSQTFTFVFRFHTILELFRMVKRNLKIFQVMYASNFVFTWNLTL